MPGMAVDGLNGGDGGSCGANGHDILKNDFTVRTSPKSPLSPRSRGSGSVDLSLDDAIDTSIEQLYHNVCDMQSSDQSPSRASFVSYGAESRIDSELCHLVGVDVWKVKKMKEATVEIRKETDEIDTTKENGKSFASNGSGNEKNKISGKAKRGSPFRSKTRASARSTPRTNSSIEKIQVAELQAKSLKKTNSATSEKRYLKLSPDEAGIPKEAASDDPNAGLVLLRQARGLLSSNSSERALKLALRAKKAFEACEPGKPNLDMAMCLHVLAVVYCKLGQYNDAIPVLEQSIEIPSMDEGQNHALAKFAGCMQLGDTYSMLGQLENSILCYTAGLEIQRQVLGENDPRVGETCRYAAEAYVQALRFDEAESLCQSAIDIHRENSSSGSVQEAADRRLMGLICDAKGDHEAAIEHYVLASMYMSSFGNEAEMAAVDCNIGDAYLSLSRYGEAVSAYQKALAGFKKSKGENHPAVASVYVRLAELNNKIGHFKESKLFCEDALRIYQKPLPGIPAEDYASGFVEVSAIFESMNDLKMSLKLLQKALKTYSGAPGQQSTMAGIEAQMGVLNYVMGNYQASYELFKSAILKLRGTSEKKPVLLGIALNQMGLACVQKRAITEAAELFEEARDVLEKEIGPDHPDTMGVYSNLAGTYDAMGRLNDAIEILEYVVRVREEKLGTANPDVDDEKRRLAELLREAGRARNRRSVPLERLLGGVESPQHMVKDTIEAL
uniref:Kinesin light chain n=1 Tax=Kalanchoe fedtschenkoi TaxID=63787 RepID=A0A7N0T2T3_KALFE